MTYTVYESAHASRDLDMIVAYLVDTLKNAQAARRVLDEYEQLLDALEETPLSYPIVRDDLLAFAGYHWAPVSSYMVFFTVNEKERRVDIHRIAHKSRNWIQLLR